MMGTENFKIDAPWAEKFTKTRVQFLLTPSVGGISKHCMRFILNFVKHRLHYMSGWLLVTLMMTFKTHRFKVKEDWGPRVHDVRSPVYRYGGEQQAVQGVHPSTI